MSKLIEVTARISTHPPRAAGPEARSFELQVPRLLPSNEYGQRLLIEGAPYRFERYGGKRPGQLLFMLHPCEGLESDKPFSKVQRTQLQDGSSDIEFRESHYEGLGTLIELLNEARTGKPDEFFRKTTVKCLVHPSEGTIRVYLSFLE